MFCQVCSKLTFFNQSISVVDCEHINCDLCLALRKVLCRAFLKKIYKISGSFEFEKYERMVPMINEKN